MGTYRAARRNSSRRNSSRAEFIARTDEFGPSRRVSTEGWDEEGVSPWTAVTDEFEHRSRARTGRELLAHSSRCSDRSTRAEDLVQETMLRAWRSYDRYDDQRASLRTWLYRIRHQRVPDRAVRGGATGPPCRRGSVHPGEGSRAGSGPGVRRPVAPADPRCDAGRDPRRPGDGAVGVAGQPSGWRSSRPCSTCRLVQRAILIFQRGAGVLGQRRWPTSWLPPPPR